MTAQPGEERPALHPAVRDVMRYFEWAHLPAGPLQETSKACAELAWQMVERIGSCPQLTIGLQDLLRAKDAFVRANLAP